MATKYTDAEIEEAFTILGKIANGCNDPLNLAKDFLISIYKGEPSETQQETFEMFGYTWIPHVPGNPQPVANNIECFVLKEHLIKNDCVHKECLGGKRLVLG